MAVTMGKYGPFLTLADLVAFDPDGGIGYANQKWLCPLPECAGHRSRKLYVHVESGKWFCQRCNAKGKLRQPRPVGGARLHHVTPEPPDPLDELDLLREAKRAALDRLWTMVQEYRDEDMEILANDIANLAAYWEFA